MNRLNKLTNKIKIIFFIIQEKKYKKKNLETKNVQN